MFPLLQGVQPDTVVMVPVRSAFDYIQLGATALMVLGLFVLLMVFVRILKQVEGLTESIDPLVDRASKGLEPVLERARSVSENVDYVSHAVRRDVEGLTEALDRIRGRMDQASDRMEERIEEFNALMELVQEEADLPGHGIDSRIPIAGPFRSIRPPGRRRSTRGPREGARDHAAPRSRSRARGHDPGGARGVRRDAAFAGPPGKRGDPRRLRPGRRSGERGHPRGRR